LPTRSLKNKNSPETELREGGKIKEICMIKNNSYDKVIKINNQPRSKKNYSSSPIIFFLTTQQAQ
jgi:hypothetical protein